MKWTFPLLTTVHLTLTKIPDDHRRPTKLPNPVRSSFQTLPSLLLHRFLSAWRAFHPVFALYLIPQFYFRIWAWPSCGLAAAITPLFQFRRRCFSPFLRVVDYRLYRCIINWQMISLQKTWCIHNTKELVVVICTSLRTVIEEKPIAGLAFLANLKATFDSQGVFRGDAVWFLVYLIGDGAIEIY